MVASSENVIKLELIIDYCIINDATFSFSNIGLPTELLLIPLGGKIFVFEDERPKYYIEREPITICFHNLSDRKWYFESFIFKNNPDFKLIGVARIGM